MKTATKPLFVSLTLALTLAAAANAQPASSRRSGMGLFEVLPLDPSSAVAVGANGTILGTTDAGLTWTPRVSGTTHALFAVAFADAHVGAAVGELGTILKTSDGGITWAPAASPTTDQLRAVSFADPNTIAVAGISGTIVRTADGGFTCVITSFRTNDGGASWTAGGETSLGFRGVSLPDPSSGIIAGALERMLSVKDSSGTWKPRARNDNNAIIGVTFLEAATGKIAGPYRTTLQTTDGVTWSPWRSAVARR